MNVCMTLLSDFTNTVTNNYDKERSVCVCLPNNKGVLHCLHVHFFKNKVMALAYRLLTCFVYYVTAHIVFGNLCNKYHNKPALPVHKTKNTHVDARHI